MKAISWLPKAFFAAIVFASVPAIADEYLNGIEWKKPPIICPGEKGGPPSDAIVLFNGKDMTGWKGADNWKVENGNMICGKGAIRTEREFGDCQLHIEWSAPTPVSGEGQGRGNSGVFFMDNYEIQVLDSYGNETYYDGQAGSIYKQTPPAVNAMVGPGHWNVYDLIWTSPRFNEDGTLRSPAYITALHNGVLILNHFELQGDNPFSREPQYNKHADRLPIRLQDHGNPVRFRNIWIRDIKPPEGKQVKKPFIRDKDGKEKPVE